MDFADLHIHSFISDGLLSPEEIVDWGIVKKLKAISITDHDSILGIQYAKDYSVKKDIEVIPGIELSTEYNDVEVHILGYFIDINDSYFLTFLKKLENSRMERTKTMILKLNKLGYNIEFEDILNEAQNASSMGRPHIARVMVNKGYCKSTEEVFDRFIGFGKPAYVERYKISPFQALELIAKCKGVSSIAHPGLIINVDKYLLIKKLKEWGLTGIEVYHTKHTVNDSKLFEQIACKLDLIPTGGTDCHGVMINNEPMIGNITVPYENVNRLRNVLKKLYL